MSYGLEVFKANGDSVIKIDDRIVIKIAEVEIPEGIGVVNVPVPGIVDDGTWVIVRFGIGIEFTIQPDNVQCNRVYNFTHLNGANIWAGNGISYSFEDYFRVYRF